MKTITKTILLITILVTAQSLNLRKQGPSPVELLKKFSQTSDFSKNVVNSVLLHLQTGGQVDDVITYIKQAIADSQSDFNNLTSEAEAEYTRLEGLISGLNTDINEMNGELQQTILTIASLNGEIDTLNTRITNLEAELTGLNEREQRINDARNNDVLAFAQRQDRDTAAIAALNNIIPALNNLLVDNSPILLERSKEQISEQLTKVPLSSPIMALVQMSTAFNAAKLRGVIEKLQTIRAGIEANQAKDAEQHAESENRYNALLLEVSELRASKSAALASAKGELAGKEAELALAKSKKGQLETNITTTQDLLDSTVAVQTQTKDSYTRRLGEAKAAIEGLQTVLQILEEGAESLRDRESFTAGLASQL